MVSYNVNILEYSVFCPAGRRAAGKRNESNSNGGPYGAQKRQDTHRTGPDRPAAGQPPGQHRRAGHRRRRRTVPPDLLLQLQQQARPAVLDLGAGHLRRHRRFPHQRQDVRLHRHLPLHLSESKHRPSSKVQVLFPLVPKVYTTLAKKEKKK